MNNPILYRIAVVAAFVAAIVSIACGGTRPSRFFLLESSPAPDKPLEVKDVGSQILIGLMPIDLADYLDRPQLVSTYSDNRVEYAEYDRWAEPLGYNLSRVLREEINGGLEGAIVVDYPLPPQIRPVYRVSLKIVRLDVRDNGSAVLSAKWAVGHGRNGDWIKEGTTRLTAELEEGKKPDYTARVGAINGLVLAMCDQITRVLAGLLENRSAP
jgi:uncharacterized lipoprotein YmbA